MELRGGVSVDVAVQTGDSEAGVSRLAIVCRIELVLREWRKEKLKPIELNRRQDIFEEVVEVVDRNDLASRDVLQLRTIAQKDSRRGLRKELLR